MRVAAMRALIVTLLIHGAPAFGDEAIRYNEDIRPILAEHCFRCHGPDEGQRESGLRLDREADAKQAAIIAGDPLGSLLVDRITTDDPDLKMPPPATQDELSEAQVQLLVRWIAAGASYEQHWSFTPIDNAAVPEVGKPVATDIDRFVVAKLAAHGLRLSPRISREQWIRRATYDLLGLPPTWEEVEAFLRDESPQACEKVIDRLLASRHYGERWGRHWLDLARYADTHGGSAIGFTRFPFSYTYRDYVIQAFHTDLPYDRFVIEQLAADQLGLDEHDPALAALGFLTVGMQFRNRHDVIDDQIDVTTRGLLGLTVACARCHDHKYDPIPTTDYYALYATFACSEVPGLPPILGSPPASAEYTQYRQELTRRLIHQEDLARDQSEVMRSRLRMQVGLYLRELAKGTPEQDVSSAFLSYRTDDLRPTVLNRWRAYLAQMTADDPVFGPWVQLSREAVDRRSLAERCAELLRQWRTDNGDPAQFANEASLATEAPRWNPRVLDALEAERPESMLDVADAYGELFAAVHRAWLVSLLEASLEAAPFGEIIPDEDPRHGAINSAITRQLRRHLYEPGSPTALARDDAAKLLNRTVRDNLSGKEGAIHDLQLNAAGSPPRAMVLSERIPDRPYHVLRRGNPLDRGEEVQPHFLTALTANRPAETTIFADGQRRLGLARAITDPENPLLRRVIVNWVWQHHIGQALVRTPDDFGTRSEPPTHPDLLDYLASKFLEDGWSLKALHKRIMLSDVYAQACAEDDQSRAIDPDNQLLWRMPRRRLDMEAMRDGLLAVSGELELSDGGGRPFDLLATPTVPRRTVYGFVNRDIVSSLMSTFDAANPSSCTAQRPVTTVPQQTLFALNSEFIQDRASAFAELATSQSEDVTERIRIMFRRAYAREPDDNELHTARAFVAGKSSAERWTQLAHVLMAANEFVFPD